MSSITLIKSIFFGVMLILVANSCADNSGKTSRVVIDGHSSKIALDWPGVYKGILPCADCEGIETKIIIKRDETFQKTLKYLGKDDKVFFEEGEFHWDESGSRITLKLEGSEQQYQVGENVLFHLDVDGQRISGELAENYKLYKNLVDPGIEDKKWLLIEIGNTSIESATSVREGFIQFSMETGSFFGNNTCNNIFGNYELFEGGKIMFGPLGSTRMACPGIETEQQFMDVLQMAEYYSVLEDVFTLNDAGMNPLARFRYLAE